MQPRLLPRVRDVGAAGQHGDGAATALERPDVRGAVDPQGHAADHGDPRRGQPATERPGDLEAIVRRAARADDGHRRRLVRAAAGQLAQTVDRRLGPAEHEQGGGCGAVVTQARRVGGVAPAERDEPAVAGGGQQVGGPAARQRVHDRGAIGAADRVEQRVIGEREHVADRAALVAGDLDAAGQEGEELRAAQAVGAGTGGHAVASCATSTATS
jgi:hypothetical protein